VHPQLAQPSATAPVSRPASILARGALAVALSVLAASALGCATQVRDAQQLVTLTPPAPAMAGTYDFELLSPIVGRGCVERGSGAFVSATVLGVRLESGLIGQSQAAAVFDAMSKVSGVDAILVTRMLTEGDISAKLCTTVHGRAVRLTKGPTITLTTPAAPATKGEEPPRSALPGLGK
jgi:hypothetical protein